MDAGKILGVGGDDLQQIVRRSGHQVTFQDIRHPRHGLLERLENFIRLAGQGDLDKRGRLALDLAWVQQRDITTDDPLGLQPLHPPVAGRG